MSDALSTVLLSLFSVTGGRPGTPGAGGQGYGGIGYNYNFTTGTQTNISGMGFNGLPGTAYRW